MTKISVSEPTHSFETKACLIADFDRLSLNLGIDDSEMAKYQGQLSINDEEITDKNDPDDWIPATLLHKVMM